MNFHSALKFHPLTTIEKNGMQKTITSASTYGFVSAQDKCEFQNRKGTGPWSTDGMGIRKESL